MQIPLCDLQAQFESIGGEIEAKLGQILRSGRFIGGPEVRQFEEEFAAFSGAAHAVGVASGTAALHLAMIAAGLRPGDEVLTVSHTFIATAEPVRALGATLRFVEIDPSTYGMDPAGLEASIGPKTRMVIPVHIYGHPVDLDPILEIARRHELAVIEDAAQAHGAGYRGRICGSLAPLATFSFYPGKNLGAAGDAGAVTCADPATAQRIERLANHGRVEKYLHREEGYNFRLDAIQAAVLRIKLRHLPDWTAARRRVAAAYDERLACLEAVGRPEVADWAEPVWHLYVIRVPKRDQVLARLRESGIDAGIHYPVPLHLQPAYADLGYRPGDLPITERIAGEILSLPIFPEMTEAQIDQVVDTLRACF